MVEEGEGCGGVVGEGGIGGGGLERSDVIITSWYVLL